MTSQVLRLLLSTVAVCFAVLMTGVCGVAIGNRDVTDDVIVGARCRARCLYQLQVSWSLRIQKQIGNARWSDKFVNTRVCMCCHTAVFTEQLHHTSPTVCVDVLDTEGRRRLRSSVTDTLVVPLTNRSTLGDPAFPVAVSRAWNGLPSSVRTATSLHSFRRQLKTFLYRQSFC